jgi:DMSO/TMAO reductase YedYZ heme-binding membrane subunit
MWRLPVAYLAFVAGICAAIVSTVEPGPEEVRATIRVTAFTSAVPFLLVFIASPAHRLRRSAATRWLMANRRYVGLCVAASHFWHLLAIIVFVRLYVTEPLQTVTLVFGGAGFVFLGLMAVTSTDTAQRALGAWWGRLHKTGLYVVWLDFIFTYMGPLVAFLGTFLGTPEPGRPEVTWLSPFHVVMTTSFALAWTLRLVAFFSTRRA